MISDIEQIINEAETELKKIDTLDKIEDLRVKYFGKNGEITNLLKTISDFDIESKKTIGNKLNNAKIQILEQIQLKKKLIDQENFRQKLSKEKLDITLPVRERNLGSVHPISQVIEELISIFSDFGFSYVDGPEIEDDYHNFTALNIPQNHPARQMQDSFYLKQDGNLDKLLRTQTSSVQIREMKNSSPPFKIISIGKTYRSESDITHTPMFHQIEGLLIDEDVNIGHLKYCIINFIKKFFANDNIPIRFRPSFFPFTEPSAEVDIGCIRKNNEFLISDSNDWMEILGCGMVHPKVLRDIGIDEKKYRGFAFGAGIERLTMLKYGIFDLRDFFNSDIRWIKHYSFRPFMIPSISGSK